MKQLITFLLLTFVTICTLSMNLLSKDLNEYRKWLQFHKIEDSDFQKVGDDTEKKLEWYEYDLTEEYKETFRPFRIYSTDSSYFIDLDSYSLTLEKEKRQLISYGSEIDRKVQVVKNDTKKATTLLYCGSQCYPETANWTSDKTVQILGFSIDESGKFIPTQWFIDLNNTLFSQYQTGKKYKEMPPSYMEEERLKMIKFKK